MPKKLNLERELYLKNRELYTAHKKSQKLIYNISESIFVLDSKLKITLANKKSEILFGKNHDLIGKKIDDVLFLTYKNSKIIPIKSFINSTDLNLNGLKQVIDGKDFYFNLRISVITSDDPKNEEYVVTLSDVTPEKKAEISKDDFITITSHELRTPMTIIKSYLWLLEEEKAGKLNDKQKDYIDKAINSTERMLSLINDMLSVSKLEQGKIDFKFEILEIDKFISETLPEFEIKVKENGNKLIFEHLPDTKLVLADKKRLKEILYNLIGNSIKFTKNGVIKVKTMANDKFIKISVSDTGKGIPKDDMEKLFKKFGKLENSYETMAESSGTGLGLYITKQLIEGMGGKITAKSDGENKGAEFIFFLQKK
jgi:signal transduction histidine kinase